MSQTIKHGHQSARGSTHAGVRGSTHALFGLVYVALLSGTITGQRIVGSLPNIEVRLPLAYVTTAFYMLWTVAQPKKKRSPIVQRYTTLLLVLFLFMVISAAWAPYGAAVGPKIVDFALMCLLVLIAIDIVVSEPSIVHDLWWYLLGSGIVYLAASIAAGAGGQGRYAALGGGPNVYVRVLSLGALAAVILAIRTGKMRYLLLAPLLMGGAVLSGSRGGLAALAFIIIFSVLPYLRKIGSAAIFRGAIIAVAAGGLAYQFIGQRVVSEIQSRLITQTLQNGYDSNRSSAYGDAWRLFISHPLHGVGLGGFYQDVGQYSGLVYPHNIELAYMSEGGVIATLFLVWLLLRPYFFYRRYGRTSIECRGMWWCASYMFVASQFSGGYYDARFMWFFMAATIILSIPIKSHGLGEAQTLYRDHVSARNQL